MPYNEELNNLIKIRCFDLNMRYIDDINKSRAISMQEVKKGYLFYLDKEEVFVLNKEVAENE